MVLNHIATLRGRYGKYRVYSDQPTKEITYHKVTFTNGGFIDVTDSASWGSTSGNTQMKTGFGDLYILSGSGADVQLGPVNPHIDDVAMSFFEYWIRVIFRKPVKF